MKDCLKKLIAKKDLSFEEAQSIIRKIALGEATEAQIGAFLTAVTLKGATAEEIFAFASTMREFSNRVILDKYIVDSCGTGADFSKTINISTAAAIVANACGVNVLKQTNSSITSACGSTDLLQALNITITRIPQDAKKQFDKNNIAFVHSPYFNDFARINNPIRQQIGIKTIFNYLGPLINPCFPNAQLLGVSSLEMCEKMVCALQKLGTDRALVVNGIDPNIDELSLCSKTAVFELKNNEISKYEVSPEDFGLKTVEVKELQGGNSIENSKIIQNIFKGEIKGAKRDVIALNAGAMIYLAGHSKNISEGLLIAQSAIKEGLAWENLTKLQGKNLQEIASVGASFKAERLLPRNDVEKTCS